MPATRVRVRPPHRHRGLMLLMVVYGLCGGAAYFGLVAAIERSLMPPRPATLILLSGFVLIPAAAGFYLARYCQHNWPVFLGGLLCGSAFIVGIFVVAYLGESPGPAPWWAALIVFGGALGMGALFGVLNLVLCVIHKNYGSLLVDQDGTLCVGCGYCVAHTPSAQCPECGTPRSAALEPLGSIYAVAELLDASVGTRLHHLKYAAVLAALGGGLWVWHQVPWWRFQSVFGPGMQVRSAEHRPGGVPDADHGLVAMEISRPIPSDPQGRLLIIQYYRSDFFAAPRIQLRIGWPWAGMANWTLHQDGEFRMVCDLNPEQSRDVLRHGVPETLVSDMLRRADQAGSQPPSGRGPTRPDVLFSPDPYFD